MKESTRKRFREFDSKECADNISFYLMVGCGVWPDEIEYAKHLWLRHLYQLRCFFDYETTLELVKLRFYKQYGIELKVEFEHNYEI